MHIKLQMDLPIACSNYSMRDSMFYSEMMP